ncbi:hypothetical protein KCP76_11410 [Salmonella enterica subsp. enterica serovar Weltevreden]|nr:hypothetical protein KCP76_11410 [Salmonella enterica subsp. enterica serovar Weltevreden]
MTSRRWPPVASWVDCVFDRSTGVRVNCQRSSRNGARARRWYFAVHSSLPPADTRHAGEQPCG